MSYFAPKEAKRLWASYVRNYKRDYILFAGFREWPPGINRKEDMDSGPVIFGVGAAATGLALRASSAMGDKITYFQLRNTILAGRGDVLKCLEKGSGREVS